MQKYQGQQQQQQQQQYNLIEAISRVTAAATTITGEMSAATARITIAISSATQSLY
jgi:hypothetical protein